jgi:polar amino acid transport system substrate-binding protein
MTILKFLFLLNFSFESYAQAIEIQALKCGWYSWEPYQYTQKKADIKHLTGLDIYILNSIADIAGYKVTYKEISWLQHQNRLKSGVYDIAMGATKTLEREKYCYFTIPYRESIDTLFILKNSSKRLHFRKVSEFISEVKQHQFRLGITEGYLYSDSELNAFINDKRYQHLIVKTSNTIQNIGLLRNNHIDGFLADHVNGVTIAWHNRMHEEIETYEISRSPIHFMLSKKSISLKDLRNINKTIEDFKESKEYKLAFKTYLVAPLILQTIDKRWFYIIDIIGTIAFALSGIIIAYHIQATLFTTITLAMLPAIGGGMMRDIIVGRRPLGVLQTPDYLFSVFITVFVCYIMFQLLSFLSSHIRIHLKVRLNAKFLGRALDVFDALGLAAFTVIGTNVAVISKCEPLWLWGPLLAALTGAGGGVIRDLLRPDRHVVSFMGELYAEVAIIWSLFLSIFLHLHYAYLSPDKVLWAIIITILGVFITRMAASIFNIRGPNFLSKQK